MESKKKIQRVRGNKLRLVIPLQKVTITPTGEEYEDYTVPEGAEVKVTMSNGFKRFEFTPEIVDNKLIINDEGELTNGTYAIETTVSNTDDSPLRSKFCEVVEIVDCNDTLDGDYMDYVDFIEGSVTLDAQVFWFAAGEKGEKGDKGDKGEKGETEGRLLVDNTPTYALYDAMYGNMYLMLNPVTRLQVILPPSEEEYMAQQFSIIFVADENCMIDFVGRSGVRSNIVNFPSVFITNKTYIVHCRAAVTDDASLSNVYVWFEAPLSEVAFSGAFTSLDNRPTTLAGYGITDAKIQNGVITLGGNTFSESDPTVPDWAKTQTKPTYTAGEVGAYTTDEVDDLIESIDVSDQIAGKQDTLVSGENIKTVNNQSLLGSGNVEIDIEGVVYSGSDVGQVAVPNFDPETDTVHVTAQTLSAAQKQQVRENIAAAGVNDVVGTPIANHGTSDTGTSSTPYSIAPNTLHVWGEVAALYLSLTAGDVGYVQEYMIQFASGSTATTLSLPNTLTWLTPSTISANTTYQIRIANGCVAMVNTGAAVDVSGKEDKMVVVTSAKTASFTAEVGKYYTVNVANDGSVVVTLPTTGNSATHVQSIVFLVTLGTGAAACSFTNVAKIADGFDMEDGSTYEVNALWNGSGWYISGIKMVAQS